MTVLVGSLRVHMTGSEWFAAAPGGLNRYFTDLYRALNDHPDIAVTATAFGDAPAGPGAGSWGPTGGSTLHRARTAYLDRAELLPGTVLDRHFCLYGPSTRGRNPLVVHFHGPWAAESRMAGESDRAVRAKYLVERLRYLGADRFVVLSQHFRRLLVADYRVPADKVRVIPPGVDLTRFPVPTRDRSTGTVLCVRRLERRMGIDVLVRCWPEVSAAHPDARLVIVGTGTAEAELRELARTQDSIHFTGTVTDTELTDLYARADLTVVPSLALEGFGLIALESLAAGRAPIVADCGGLPDSVRDLDPTLIVPPGGGDALAARIIRALSGARPDPSQCRAHAETFSWSAAARRHLDLYRELVTA
ncbi:GDP-mannose-dependent alpha-(1-6)-phosphatidylinositol monomannoside mannosyltransferase [Nocardia otitidiscaviarum]|uniref:GDP-mannose-dependent alpha-(1-6)-phosphatidylinositol monomannoside mannosyltransferase n=1 Tax=Nocardia otitidiscaviarum TaxID=1823 RepID=A0A379JKK2_9NOCA|nr:GDP-mannose-dependent alpha-(1-6)-phosphatidylinositol monomannoside mannosyltransferase [Nocardia otitidiscaviarum]